MQHWFSVESQCDPTSATVVAAQWDSLDSNLVALGLDWDSGQVPASQHDGSEVAGYVIHEVETRSSQEPTLTQVKGGLGQG